MTHEVGADHVAERSVRSRVRRRGEVVLAAALGSVIAPPAAAQAQSAPIVYEYVYPYDTPDLTEDHYIVLDTSGERARGWYYGTSDEFDQAREGYLPGFFVQPMADLEISDTVISFTLVRPERFFSAPVPLEHRSADAVPAGSLRDWNVPLPMESRRYRGSVSGEGLTLDVPGGPRIFRRR